MRLSALILTPASPSALVISYSLPTKSSIATDICFIVGEGVKQASGEECSGDAWNSSLPDTLRVKKRKNFNEKAHSNKLVDETAEIAIKVTYTIVDVFLGALTHSAIVMELDKRTGPHPWEFEIGHQVL